MGSMIAPCKRSAGDCGRRPHPDAEACPACGSSRVLRHGELHDLSIAHLDCDAFYAAIEKRDRPELRDRPVIVGGRHRGVVVACCYVARTYGVRSAMPMFKALKACPDAVVVKPDMKKYAAVGREVRTMMLDLTPLVEPLSIDEAFMDLSGTESLHRASAAETLAGLARRVEGKLSITVSIGLSYNKFLAKIASDLDKPRGFAVIGRAEARAFLDGKPVGLLWGVGQAMQQRLARDGITLIGELARLDEATLVARYGKIGKRLHQCARGEDDRPVDPKREAKSLSSEITLDEDLSDPDRLRPILWRLADAQALAAFWTEVRDIATELQPESVIVLQVDAALQDAAEYAPGDLPEEIAIKGRGGTDFRPGFAWLEEQGTTPSLCLYFTDMDCDRYPETEPSHPILWIDWSASAGSSREPPPWGEHIKIKD